MNIKEGAGIRIPPIYTLCRPVYPGIALCGSANGWSEGTPIWTILKTYPLPVLIVVLLARMPPRSYAIYSLVRGYYKWILERVSGGAWLWFLYSAALRIADGGLSGFGC